MRYSLDTSAFLDGYIRHYPPDIFKTLWATHVPSLIKSGDLRAVERVLSELEVQDGDSAHQWAKARSDLFVPLDVELQRAGRKIINDFPELTKSLSGGARSGGDPFVIALAQVNFVDEKTKVKVVTGERPSYSANRPRIPDVCARLKIETITFLEMIREQRWTF